MTLSDFFMPNLSKIIIAKIFGIPIVIADYFFMSSTIFEIVVLFVFIYLAACMIETSIGRIGEEFASDL